MGLLEKTLILIPAFNEEKSIQDVLKKCNEYFINILLINDGSTDKTAYKAGQFKSVSQIKHCINCGQGTAISTGVNYFINNTNLDYLITFDADGQHIVKDALDMLEYANKYSYDVVFGSRFLNKEKLDSVPYKRRLILKIAKIFEKLFYGIELSDAHNGLRVLNRKACKNLLNLDSSSMAHSTEIVKKITKSKLIYSEYPCTVLYNVNGKISQSPFNSLNIISDLLQKK